MSAKTDLFIRLKYLNAAVNLPALIDQGIAQSEHNGVANLLRKGLGIVAFNILEDFIKNKSIESLAALSNSRLQFNDLTDFLQESAISGALTSFVFNSNIQKRDGADWKALIQDEALKIHSTKNGTYELSKFSLVYNGSNVSLPEITDLLRAFGLNGGWALMKTISDKIGGGLPDLNQAYRNASSRRHNAAHTASFQYDYLWISNIRSEILTIAAVLDILLTARCRQVTAIPSKKMDTYDINAALNFRFLEPKNNIFRETTTIGGNSRKNWPDIQNAINYLQPLLKNKDEFLVVLNPSKRIEDWYV